MKLSSIWALALTLALPLAGHTEEETKQPSDRHSIELSDLIDRVAKRTGKQFILDPRVRGEVPLAGLDASKVDYERLLAILRVNLYVAVEDHGFVVVVPDANARQLTTPVYTDLKFKALDDEVVTVILEVKNACAPQLVPILRPLMPQSAHMAAYPLSNTMILSDHADNVRRVGSMIEKLDRATPAAQKCQGGSSSSSGS